VAHVALVQSGSAWTGYLNGVPVGTVSQAFGSVTGKPLNIGSSSGSGDYFPGQIDELKIYDRALTAAEVYALAQRASAGVGTAQVWLAPDAPMLPTAPHAELRLRRAGRQHYVQRRQRQQSHRHLYGLPG
jgi:hypothetical protein